MSAQQAAQAALAAGFTPQQAVIAVAISGAETGGWTQFLGDYGLHGGAGGPYWPCGGQSGPCSIGYWQINQCAHQPTLAGMAGTSDPCAIQTWLLNPSNCARAAYVVSNHGTDWTPWTTYNDGRYRAYLQEASAAVKAASGGGGGSQSSPGSPAFIPIPQALPSWVLPAGLMIIAVALLGAGIEEEERR